MSEELPPPPGRLAPGSLLAGYRCEEEIGRGGMAVVYRAYDDHLDRPVALKVLAPDLARDEVFRARFIQESRIAAATEHPNIIPVFSAGEADGVLLAACLPGTTGAGVPYSPTRAAMPATPATVADAGPPGPAPAPSAGAGFPPPPPAGFPPPPLRTGFPPPPAEPDPATLRWPGQPDPAYAGDGDGRDRRRSRGAFTAGLVAVLLVLFVAAAGVTYFVLHQTRGTGPDAAGSGAAAGPSAPSAPASAAPTAPASSSTVPAPPSPPPPGVLAATVRAYYAAINNHRYARAWRLGGRNAGETYRAFVSGFATTAHDTVTIQSVSGDVVTAQLVAEQTDGTVKTYQGSYTVEGGVITQFSVRQVG
jgi:hypothetical protein